MKIIIIPLTLKRFISQNNNEKIKAAITSGKHQYSCNKNKSSTCPELVKAIKIWHRIVKEHNINDPLLKKQGFKFANLLGLSIFLLYFYFFSFCIDLLYFKASNGWLDNFKTTSFKKVIDQYAAKIWMEEKLPDIIKNY